MRSLSAIAAVAATILMSTPILAQEGSIGVKMGGAFGSVVGADVEDGLGIQTGLSIGGFAEFPSSPSFSLQMEFLVVQKGVKGDFSFRGERNEVDLTWTYGVIPLLARVRLPTLGSIDTHAVFGGYMAVAMSCSGISNGEEVDGDCVDDLFLMDLGLMAGPGFGIDLGDGQATLDVRYDLSTTSINAGTLEEDDQRNRVFEIMVGYAFPF